MVGEDGNFRSAHRLHAWKGGEALFQPASQGDGLRGRIAAHSGSNGKLNHMAGTDTEILALQMNQAGGKQPGSGQQDNGHSDLKNHQPFTQAHVGNATRQIRSVPLERALRGNAGDAQGGHQAEQDSGEERDCRSEEQYRVVQPRLQSIGAEALRNRADNSPQGDSSDRCSRQAAAHGEEQAFSQQEAQQAPPPRAKRQSHRNFLLPRLAFGYEQAGEIGAGNHQDKADHGNQEYQQLFDFRLQDRAAMGAGIQEYFLLEKKFRGLLPQFEYWQFILEHCIVSSLKRRFSLIAGQGGFQPP